MAKKPRGRPFKKGEGGRPKGTLNKATIEIKALAQQLLSDPDYLHALKWRLQHGEAGAVEPLLYHYGYGKPKETLEVQSAPVPLVIDLLRSGT